MGAMLLVAYRKSIAPMGRSYSCDGRTLAAAAAIQA